MCADTTVQEEEEEEEDPSDGKSDYALDEDAIISDLSSGNSFTSSFSPITNTYNLTSTYPTTKEIVPPAYPQ